MEPLFEGQVLQEGEQIMQEELIFPEGLT